MTPALSTAPVVEDTAVTFTHPDPDGRLAGVRLRPDAALAGPLDFTRDAGSWRLRLDRPPVDRLEYRLELRHCDGGTETVVDGANPLRAPGAFGDKSVVEFPGYAPPAWLDGAEADGREAHARYPGDALGDVEVRTWTPDGPTALLVAHDGPEYDRLASLGRYVRTATTRVALALLTPGDRNRRYAADPDYADALTRRVLPALRRDLAVDGPVVGLGASLGALSLLHAHTTDENAFDGLLLQSGSFFVPRYDAHESGFSGYGAVTAFVASVLAGPAAERPIPIVLTCGLGEENLHNNRVMAAALHARGHPGGLVEVPGAHTFVDWRDAWHPALTDLLRQV